MKPKNFGAIMAALALSSGTATAQTLLKTTNPFVTIKSVTTCYTSAAGEGLSRVWLPTVIIKVVPKINLSTLQIKASFVDLAEGESLGNGMDIHTDLEKGISYTFKLESDIGWGAPAANRKIRATPTIEISNPKAKPAIYSWDHTYNLTPSTKFPKQECL